MFAKIFLFICATFFMSQNTYAENHINREQLSERVTKFYIQMLDRAIASFQNAYEPINNDTENSKDTLPKEYALTVTELKAVLQRANVESPASSTATTLEVLKRTKNDLFTEIQLRALDIENYVTTHKPVLVEQMEKLRKARTVIREDARKSIETFVDQTLREFKKYWNGLTAMEQQEEQNLPIKLNEVKIATTLSSKLSLLSKIFDLGDIF